MKRPGVLSAVEKYAQPEVVEFWRRFSAQGLQKCEAEMLARYAPPPARVLDLGCGGGRVGAALVNTGYEVSGLDLVGDMIRAARERYACQRLPLRLMQADLRAVPCADAHYEVALIFIAALQHIAGRRARQQALAEIARVLRPDGRLILALDNLAPALTCYAWWAWRKVTARRTPARAPASSRPALDRTSAEAVLEARRTRMSGLGWHARGFARTLRWRTWNGWLDAGRQARVVPGEAGDTAIDQVSLNPTQGLVYYHLYRHAELIEDAGAAGFTLLGYHAGRELDEGQQFTPQVRQLDKQVLYAFRRE